MARSAYKGMIRLDEFSYEEWRDVARLLRPDWNDDEFEDAWLEFQEFKRKKARQ